MSIIVGMRAARCANRVRVGLMAGVVAAAVSGMACVSSSASKWQEGADAAVESGTDGVDTALAEEAVSVTVDDLGIQEPLGGEAGTARLDKGKSAGRFPAGLSIVRIGATVDPSRERRFIHPEPMAPDRAVRWNHFVDGLPLVREVTMLRSLGLDPRGARLSDLLRESINLECSLCLMYAEMEAAEADSQFVAVLWDAAHQTPLTFFRIVTELPPSVREACEEEDGPPTRECDTDFIAEADLRTAVRDHLWDLAQGDERLTTTEPNPWRHELPLYPRDYYRYRLPGGLERLPSGLQPPTVPRTPRTRPDASGLPDSADRPGLPHGGPREKLGSHDSARP